ncbi:MAG: hypothetical protein OXB88_07525 [Bacteriovoracales bacterium]|nr:hypothetical protein [Bacteriovoracales bacterium]
MRLHKISAIFFLLLSMGPPVGWGGNLSAPVSFDSADILPKGVRNLRYNSILGGANDKFGPTGSVVGVGDAMNLEVSYQRLIDGQNTEEERGILQGYLERHDRGMDGIAGKTTGEVNVAVDAQVPILAWGITDKWTMAMVVPVVTIQTHVDTGFVASNDLQKIATQLVGEGKGFKAKEVKQKTDAAISDKNDKYGYDPLPRPLTSREQTSLGDIRLINKIQLAKKTDYTLTFVNELTLPTGRTVDIDQAVDVATGDGQFDLSLGAVAAYRLSERSSFWSRLGYTWQVSDRVARRVPQDGDSSLSPDLDGQVIRDLGNSLYASVGGSVDIYKGIVLKGQYAFQYKGADEYEGDKYESYRYDFLGKNTKQRLHSLQLGINYSTVSLFRQKKFPLPLDFNLISAIPLAGENVVKDSSVVAEAAVFF